MFLNDVWNTIAKIAESFHNILRHPYGPLMSACPAGPDTSTSTPYTECASLEGEIMFVTPSLPPATVSELRSATRYLAFSATPIPDPNLQLLAPIQLLARPPLPGCSPYVLPWSSIIDDDEQGTEGRPDVPIKCEPVESQDLLFDGSCNMDTLPFVSLFDVANIKVENQCNMEPIDLNTTFQPMESTLIGFKKEYYTITPTEAMVSTPVFMVEDTNIYPSCMQGTSITSVQDKETTLCKPETRPAIQEVILSAVRTLRDRNGSSAQAIKRYLSHQASVTLPRDNSLFNVSLKRLVADGSLIQTKGTGARGSFKLTVKVKNIITKMDVVSKAERDVSTCPFPKIAERRRSSRLSITKSLAKKKTPIKFVRSTRRPSKINNEALTFNGEGHTKLISLINSSKISERTKASTPKKRGVKTLTKISRKAKKAIKSKKDQINNKIPYSMWHQVNSMKWNTEKE